MKPAVFAKCLEHAVTECGDRGLRVAAKWAAEKLNHVARDDHNITDSMNLTGPTGMGSGRSAKVSGSKCHGGGAADGTDDDLTSASFVTSPTFLASSSSSSSSATRVHFSLLPQPHKWLTPLDRLLYLEAKAYFDCHEYLRCAHRLMYSDDPKCLFLWGYALYLAGERVASEERGDPVTGMTRPTIDNRRVAEIVARLAQRKLGEVVKRDPWLQYLLGLMHVRLESTAEATTAFLQSVNMYPYNWSAWSELVRLTSSMEKYMELLKSLPSGPMRRFFTIAVHDSGVYDLELADDALQDLSHYFYHESPVFSDLEAHVHFSNRNLEHAIRLWSNLVRIDPYRLDSFPTFALALFYEEQQQQLGDIARHILQVDKCRPEPWIVLANMHAFAKEHHSAVNALQRALRLDSKNVESWVLLANELSQMKQTDAAVAAYNMALNIHPHDHRALFGLGNLYYTAEMDVVALEYFDRATAVRPHDARLWPYLARCLYRLSKFDAAVVAAKRAVHLCAKFKTPVDPDMYTMVAKALAASKPKPSSTSLFGGAAAARPTFKITRSPRASWAVARSPRASPSSSTTVTSAAYVSGRTHEDDAQQRQRMAARGLGGGYQHQLQQQRERSGSPGARGGGSGSGRSGRAGSAGGGGGGGGGTSTEDEGDAGDAVGDDDPLTWYLAAWKYRTKDAGGMADLTPVWGMDMVEYLVESVLSTKGPKEQALTEYLEFAQEMARRDGSLQSRLVQLNQLVVGRGGAGLLA